MKHFSTVASIGQLKGTGFSPYIDRVNAVGALAPEVMRSAAIAFMVCMAFAGALQSPAQENRPWEQIPTPRLHDFKPQQPKRIVLKNGIVVFLEEDHELPFVSGSILIPGGSRDEDPAKTGLVDLYGQAWRTS